MKRSKHHIGTLVLFVMFVSIHSVSAHVGQLGHVDAIAIVEPLKVGNDNYIRSTAKADVDTGIHASNEQHVILLTYLYCSSWRRSGERSRQYIRL